MRLSPDITTRTSSPRLSNHTQEPADLRRHAIEERQARTRQLVTSYQAGQTIKALSAQFNLHHRTIRRHLLEAGVTLRQQHSHLDTTQIAEAATRYREGWTLHRLANHYGVHRNTIQRYLAQPGVPRRPLGRPPKN